MSDLDDEQLWICYLALGGELSRSALDEALRGEAELTAREHDRVATALNDGFVEAGMNHPVPLAHELDAGTLG